MDKYKVDITLKNIPEDEYDITLEDLRFWLDDQEIEFEVGIGEQE